MGGWGAQHRTGLVAPQHHARNPTTAHMHSRHQGRITALQTARVRRLGMQHAQQWLQGGGGHQRKRQPLKWRAVEPSADTHAGALRRCEDLGHLHRHTCTAPAVMHDLITCPKKEQSGDIETLYATGRHAGRQAARITLHATTSVRTCSGHCGESGVGPSAHLVMGHGGHCEHAE